MDERGAHIDIVFRNGLKDFEVLPPPGVWNRIHPAIKTNHRSYFFARAAAMIAVVASLGFIAYRLSLNVSEVLENRIIAFNIEAAYPLNDNIPAVIPAASEKAYNPLTSSHNLSTLMSEEIQAGASAPDIGSGFVTKLQNTQASGDSEIRSFEGLRLRQGSASSDETYVYEELKIPDLDLYASLKNNERWSMGAIASPTYYGRFGSGNDESASRLKSSEQTVLSYTGGLAFYYKLSKRFSIQSGIYYSSLAQQVEGINSFVGFQKYDFTKGSRNFEVQTTNGRVYTNNADVFLLADGPEDRVITNYTNDLFDPKKANLQYINNSLQQSFSYLELPLILRFKLVDRTIDLNLIGGISYNMLLGNNVFTYVDGGKYHIGKTEGLSPISISSSLGMGMEYSFSPSFSLNLEPTFRYYLNPLNELSGSGLNPYSFGIFSGVTYSF